MRIRPATRVLNWQWVYYPLGFLILASIIVVFVLNLVTQKGYDELTLKNELLASYTAKIVTLRHTVSKITLTGSTAFISPISHDVVGPRAERDQLLLDFNNQTADIGKLIDHLAAVFGERDFDQILASTELNLDDVVDAGDHAFHELELGNEGIAATMLAIMETSSATIVEQLSNHILDMRALQSEYIERNIAFTKRIHNFEYLVGLILVILVGLGAACGRLIVLSMLRKEAALSIVVRKAEMSDRAKSYFLANMSHELRTPLNAIMGFSEMIRDAQIGPVDARYRDYANDIHRSGEHLLFVINDILDLSKLESGNYQLKMEDVDFKKILADCHKLTSQHGRERGVRVTCRVCTDLPKVNGDSLRLKQVIINLMANAVKFTQPGGSVSVIVEADGYEGVRVIVRDTGIGMSLDEAAIAMQPFGQVDSGMARKYSGTGLGLPLAKRLTEMHYGKFDVTSQKGVGTTVTVYIPTNRPNVDGTQKAAAA